MCDSIAKGGQGLLYVVHCALFGKWFEFHMSYVGLEFDFEGELFPAL